LLRLIPKIRADGGKGKARRPAANTIFAAYSPENWGA